MTGANPFQSERHDHTATPALSQEQRTFLLRLARASIQTALLNQSPAPPEPAGLDAPLVSCRACFVTLQCEGRLRGCIGHLVPHAPLYLAVMEAARQAAVADPRFPRVDRAELPEITVEISVLSELTPLDTELGSEALLAQLQPHLHGVVMHVDDGTSTFLPQVWEQIPEEDQFLDRLAQKGGWDPSIWRSGRARISIYTVEHFQEIPYP